LSTLSIFVDETGSFKGIDPDTNYYGLVLLFHEQKNSIADELMKLDSALRDTLYQPGTALHSAPMIRREDEYANQSIDQRRQQFSRLFAFIRHCPVSYKSFVFRKKDVMDFNADKKTLKLLSRLSRKVSIFMRDNLDFFTSFDTIIAYYDNGQSEISQILTTVFSALLFEVDFRPASPKDYRLLQAADMICTLETLKAKQLDKSLTKSESAFFYKPQELRKNYLAALARKKFDAK
jgi:hypothetical protein